MPSWASSSHSSPRPPSHPGDLPPPQQQHQPVTWWSSPSPLLSLADSPAAAFQQPLFGGLSDATSRIAFGGNLGVEGNLASGDWVDAALDWNSELDLSLDRLGDAADLHVSESLPVPVVSSAAEMLADMPGLPAMTTHSSHGWCPLPPTGHNPREHARSHGTSDPLFAYATMPHFDLDGLSQSHSCHNTTSSTSPPSIFIPSNPAPTPAYASTPSSSAHSTGPKRKAPADAPELSEPDEENETVVQKRQRNTLAARKYRQKRLDRISDLEKALGDMTTERDELKLQLARREAEVEALRGMLSNK